MTTSGIAFYFKKSSQSGDTRRGSSLLVGIVSGFYSIFLGFVIYLLWSDYQDARVTVVDETTKLYILTESSKDFPPEVAKQIRVNLVNYLTLVINDEWPSMKRGRESLNATEAIDQLYDTILAYRPSNNAAILYYDKALTALNAAIEDRNHRINMLDLAIPTSWYMMIFIGALFILIMSVFLLKNTLVNLLMHVFLCAFLAFYITAVTDLSYSFSGAVSNEPFKKLLINIKNPD
ncbi:DUF4239 domain-containing protein [Legionella cardiaca]|uniref:DUF4239 domain-containing protein n=1 Tax=Legionella cardiaca TaxID=1071983 RepID=A0ABY8AUM1_9GAMM|nr:DUF4239 domain-containing protein [Legionella cardiaca]WED44373.1 DUF4239 domain-containing protein [Legionella cardiaca]